MIIEQEWTRGFRPTTTNALWPSLFETDPRATRDGPPARLTSAPSSYYFGCAFTDMHQRVRGFSRWPRSKGTTPVRRGYGGFDEHQGRFMVESTMMPLRASGNSFYAAFASFSVACFVLAWLGDLAYWATVSVLWETISVWLLAVGLVVGSIAILSGLVDLVRSRRVAGLGQPPLLILGQAVAFALSLVNVLVHSRDGYTAVVPLGLALSCLTVLILLISTIVGRTRLTRRRAEGLAQ